MPNFYKLTQVQPFTGPAHRLSAAAATPSTSPSTPKLASGSPPNKAQDPTVSDLVRPSDDVEIPWELMRHTAWRHDVMDGTFLSAKQRESPQPPSDLQVWTKRQDLRNARATLRQDPDMTADDVRYYQKNVKNKDRDRKRENWWTKIISPLAKIGLAILAVAVSPFAVVGSIVVAFAWGGYKLFKKARPGMKANTANFERSLRRAKQTSQEFNAKLSGLKHQVSSSKLSSDAVQHLQSIEKDLAKLDDFADYDRNAQSIRQYNRKYIRGVMEQRINTVFRLEAKLHALKLRIDHSPANARLIRHLEDTIATAKAVNVERQLVTTARKKYGANKTNAGLAALSITGASLSTAGVIGMALGASAVFVAATGGIGALVIAALGIGVLAGAFIKRIAGRIFSKKQEIRTAENQLLDQKIVAMKVAKGIKLYANDKGRLPPTLLRELNTSLDQVLDSNYSSEAVLKLGRTLRLLQGSPHLPRGSKIREDMFRVIDYGLSQFVSDTFLNTSYAHRDLIDKINQIDDYEARVSAYIEMMERNTSSIDMHRWNLGGNHGVACAGTSLREYVLSDPSRSDFYAHWQTKHHEIGQTGIRVGTHSDFEVFQTFYQRTVNTDS